MENDIYGDLIIIYPKLYSNYLRGTRGQAATCPNRSEACMLSVHMFCIAPFASNLKPQNTEAKLLAV